jgi:hypothetical protein
VRHGLILNDENASAMSVRTTDAVAGASPPRQPHG